MTFPVLSMAIRHEKDVVAVRQRSRDVARLLGFDPQDQTRLTTAVSEIARNAFRYAGGGRIEFVVEGATSPQLLIIRVTDTGPGIDDLQSILEGRYTSQTGMGMGIIGVRRLLDQFDLVTEPGKGTSVTLKKIFPRRAPLITSSNLAKLLDDLSTNLPMDDFAELEQQNQELLRTLDELRKRQEDLTLLNGELEDTNRGVVALYAELDEKADHLRRADTLKTRFLSNMSHEFRSPLNSILALSGLLLGCSDGPLTAEQNQQVAFIKKAAEDLFELVNDLLDLAKVEAGKVELRPTEFEVPKLFGALRGMLRPLFLNQSIGLVFDETDEMPVIYSDEGKISQILRNFISNALKFTERGEVRVAAKAIGDRALFSVADTGIGIAPEHREKIFEDFAQLENPMQRRTKGTGLGLPLCRQLAKLLNGTVSVESEVGRGSTFFLDIPLQFVSDEPPMTPAVIEQQEDGLPVLIVENRPETILMYSKWLRGSSFRMMRAGSTLEATKLLAAEKPAVIVLDILLDGEDTWSLLASVKADGATHDIPVVVVSMVEDPGNAYHLGADEYLVKPISREQFLEALRRMTRQRSTPRILIIDDDERDRYLLKHRLRASRAQIDEAVNGPEGVARAIADRPAVIFLDLAIAGESGFEVLEILKSDARTRSIDVIVHTSQRLDERSYERLAGRAAAIVPKHQLNDSPEVDAIVARLAARDGAGASAPVMKGGL